MRLPSLEYLSRNTSRTFRRFPWVLAAAFAATALAIANAEAQRIRSGDAGGLTHALMAAGLGISFLFGISMGLERLRLRPLGRIPIFLAALALLAGYAYSMQGRSEYQVWGRYALFFLASHLFASVAPYLRGGYTRGFWEYNHRLFVRFIASAVFSSCLFLGLAAALAAVKYLFKLYAIPERAFFWLWTGVAGIFNTWFFLAGVPESLEELEGDRPYPAPAKILTQYILIPLVTLYLAILYAYALKILVTRQWPIGWVSLPILICSLLGILSLLLIHPIRDRDENKWVKSFSRVFFLALLPLLGLLFTAVGKRISEYRITESRYFALATAAWLAGIALYFTFGRRRNIKMVPLTLGLLALSTSCGPWGAFRVSERSQIARLRSALEARHLLREGKLARSAEPIDKKAEAEIGSMVDYLVQRKALAQARAWLPDSARARLPGVLENREAFLGMMGLKYVRTYRGDVVLGPAEYRYYAIRSGGIRPIAGFDYYLDGFKTSGGNRKAQLTPAPDSCRADFSAGTGRLLILCRESPLTAFELKPWLDSLGEIYRSDWNKDIPPESLYLERTAEGYTIGVQLREISRKETDTLQINLNAGFYVKIPH